MFEKFLKREEVVSCEVCKCLLKKSEAKTITIHDFNFLFEETAKIYFCATHEPKYDFIKRGIILGDRYFKYVQVDKDGKLIK